MAEVWSAYDSRGRYRIRLIVNETWTDAGSNTSGGNWSLTLFGSSGWNFYGWTTYGNVIIDGLAHWSESKNNPASGWSPSGGYVLASGNWGGVGHESDGSRHLGFSAHFNATGVDSSYGPGSALDVSGGMWLTDFPRAPSAPYGLVVKNITAVSFGVQYNRNNNNGAGIDQDHAQWATDSGFSNVVWNDYGPGGYTDPSGISPPLLLQNNTQYFVRIRSHNSVGWSGWSGTQNGTTIGHPNAPTGLTATPSTSVTGRVNLSWTASSNAGSGGVVGYNIFRNGVQIATTTGTGTTFAANGGTPYTSYAFTVAARNSYSTSVGGTGAQSSAANAVAPGPPGAPTSLGAVSNSLAPGEVFLNWTAPANTGAGGITGYKIRLADGTLIESVNGTSTAYTASGLTPGIAYTFKVSARNALSDAEGTESAFSNTALVTPVGEPNAPTGVTVVPSVAVSNRLVISWTPPSAGLSGYNIFRRISGTDTLVGRVNASHTSFTIDDLVAGSAYTYVVRGRTVYTDSLTANGYPGNWGGPASSAVTGTATVNNSQSVPSLTVTTSGTNAIFNGTYTISAVTPNSIKYAKVAANIPTASSGGTVINNTNFVFNGTFTVATPTSTSIQYAKTSANIAQNSVGGGTLTDTTNTSMNGTRTVTAVNVGAKSLSYTATGPIVPSVAVPNNEPPGQTGWVTNLVNSVFNGTGKTILSTTEFTFSYAQTASNVAESNTAGIVTNITNRDTFNGVYQVLSIPSFNTVRYTKLAPSMTTRTWFKPNGVVYRDSSPSTLEVRYRSGWAG